MATMQQALEAVRGNSSRTGSLIELFAQKKTELEQALANQMTPEIQAAIDEVLDIETRDASAIDAALNTGVPPAPPAQG
jgi:hypothetical protein